jgi:hypothetical protein
MVQSQDDEIDYAVAGNIVNEAQALINQFVNVSTISQGFG